MQRPCPVNATQELKEFLLFRREGGMAATIVFGIGFQVYGPSVGLPAGIALGLYIDRATRDYPGGFLQQRVSAALSRSRLAQKHPGFRQFLSNWWLTKGSIPPPGCKERYHP